MHAKWRVRGTKNVSFNLRLVDVNTTNLKGEGKQEEEQHMGCGLAVPLHRLCGAEKCVTCKRCAAHVLGEGVVENRASQVHQRQKE